MRVAPKNTVQGAALAKLMHEDGCRKLQILDDKEVYGAGLAQNVRSAAEALGLEIADHQSIDKTAANFRSLAARGADAGVDCMVYAGITANNAVQLFKDFAAAVPDARLYGADGISDESFTDPANGGLPADVAQRTRITVADACPLGTIPARRPGVLQRVSSAATATPPRTRGRSTATRRCGWR